MSVQLCVLPSDCVHLCLIFPSCGHFPCQSPVSCQCSVSIYSPVSPLSKHLFVSLWLYVPATQTFWGVLYFDSVSVWISFWSLKPKFGSKTSYFRHIQAFICPYDAPSTFHMVGVHRRLAATLKQINWRLEGKGAQTCIPNIEPLWTCRSPFPAAHSSCSRGQNYYRMVFWL